MCGRANLDHNFAVLQILSDAGHKRVNSRVFASSAGQVDERPQQLSRSDFTSRQRDLTAPVHGVQRVVKIFCQTSRLHLSESALKG